MPWRAPPEVMARIEPHATEALADPWHGPEQGQGLRTVLLGRRDAELCQIAAELVVGAQQGEASCEALLSIGSRLALKASWCPLAAR